MKILSEETSAKIRKKFIESFVDLESEYYRVHISDLKKCSDGLMYVGYLWDCLKNFTVVNEKTALNSVRSLNSPCMVMWDLNSCDYIFIPNYWKYPKYAVIELSFDEYFEKKSTFPEDHYVFDHSFQMAIVFTHEEVKGERWCEIAYGCKFL